MVVFISITASFLLEEYRTTRNRESLKNRALGRMLENFKTDIKDTRFNIWLQQNAIQAAEKVKRATKNKAKTPQDSIDQWLTKAYTTATTFVDNTEEYNSLNSSGYLEQVDNDHLIQLMHRKYTQHRFSKKIEDYIGNYFNDLIREKLFVYVTHTDSSERLFDQVNGFPLLHFSPEILQDRNLTARLDYLTLNRHSLIEIQAGILKRTLELDSLVRIEIGKN